MATDVRVAWWNLENLFDSVNAPRDPDLAATLGNELNGWTTLVRDRKISQLASIIELMFAGAGPDRSRGKQPSIYPWPRLARR